MKHIKNKFNFQLTLFNMVGLILSLVLGITLIGFVPVLANSSSFGDSNVSLEKVYVNGGTEVTSLELGPGDVVKVRLKYNNTASTSSANVNIQDNLPVDFSLIPGSIKNCLLDVKCVSLSDSVVSSSLLSVAPSAGYFGYSNTTNSSNLELGKKRHLYSTICNQISQKEVFEQNVGNSSLFIGDCSSLVNGSLSLTNTFDLLGNRYIHQTTCTQSGGAKEIFIQSVDNSATHTGDCTNAGGTLDSTNTFDLLDRASAGGYIEYQMKSATNIDLINYGTTATMSGAGFTTVSENLSGSLVLKMFCENILPVDAQRDLTLSDAELRTDQDFTCNYNARICPIVFQDIDSNGIKNGSDTFIDNTSVQLLADDQSTVLDTLNYLSSSSPCFNSLVSGVTYYLRVPTPPTPASTTGGNTLIQYISYNTGRRDVYFGYTNGELTLSTPTSISLSGIQVSTTETNSLGNIPEITVIDSRFSSPGWDLSATVDNFLAIDSSNFVIPVANKLTNTPGTTLVINGTSTGINPGNIKTVTGTTDPMSILSSSNGNGTGNYKIETGIELVVPPFVRATSYNSNYIFTLI